MANSLDEYLNNDATDENGFPLYRAERVDGVTRIRPTQERRGNALGQVTQVASDPPITDLGAALAKLGEMIKAGVQYDQRFTGDVVNVARNVLVNPTPEFKVNREVLWKALTGKGQERKQLWPEVMVRSGLTLPGDVMSGVEPIIDPATGHTAQRVIERAQDTSGLMAGGTMFGAPRGSATMASGPNPRIQPVTERLTAPKELVKQFENVSGVTITPEGVELNVVRGQRKNDAGREAPWGTFYLPEGHTDISKVLSGKYAVGGRNKVSGKLILKNPLVIKGDPGNLANAVAKQLIGKNSEGVMLSPWADSVQLAGKLLNNSRQYTDADRVSLVKEFLTKYAPSLSDKAKDVLKTTKGLGSKPDVIYMDERLPFILTDMAAAHVAKQAGYDGVITHNGGKVQEILDLRKDKRPDHGHHELLSDSGTPGAPVSALASQSKPAPVFYSALEHAVTNAAQDAMTGAQWLGPRTERKYIDNNKQSKTYGQELTEVKYGGVLGNTPGVTPAEIEWSGLGNWLAGQKGKVTKADVQRYLDEHKVEVKDVTKSGKGVKQSTDEQAAQFEEEAAINVMNEHPNVDPDSTQFLDLVSDEAYRLADESLGSNKDGPKYSDYQLPGGENYREHLLTLPAKSKVQAYAIRYKDGPQMGEAYASKSEAEAALKELFPNRKDLEIVPEQATNDGVRTGTKPNPNDYRSSHWDEPNVLAHVRTNERDVGGKPSLHLEEIQSDWHQAGKKQGYRSAMNDIPDKPKDYKDIIVGDQIKGWGKVQSIEQTPNGLVFDVGGLKISPEKFTIDKVGSRSEIGLFSSIKSNAVPDAPFKTSWAELALKRMIRMAVEEGKDRISWTPGEAQAARYDLSKQVDQIKYLKNDDGTYNIVPFKNNSPMHAIEREAVSADKLADIVGKEVAEKIIKDQGKREGKDIGVLEGVDLKVGGEGMKGFYDNMLPKMVEKLGKQHGVKVKKAKIGTPMDRRLSGSRAMDRVQGHPDWKDVPSQDGGPRSEWFRNLTPERREQLFEAARKIGDEKTQEVYYFDIPPAWKDQAMSKGFPLFVGGIPFPVVPVDYNPFKNKDAL